MKNFLFQHFALVLVVLLAVNTKNVNCQPRNEQGVIEIDTSSSTKYNFLKEKLTDVKLVQLGEIAHGDGLGFAHKVEIIKFLHEEMGFNVVLFESPFCEMELVNQYYNPSDVAKKYDSLYSHIYPIWSATKEVEPLIEYIKQENIELSGFDSRQIFYSWNFPDSLQKYFPTAIELADIDSMFYTTMKILLKKEYDSRDLIIKKEKANFLKKLDKLIEAVSGEYNNKSFWYQCLISIKGCALNSWQKDSKVLKGAMLRDKYMAKNLLWLINEKYKNEKVVVWAHSGHVCRNNKELYPITNVVKLFHPNYLTVMGDYVYNNKNIKSYTISFIYYQGKSSFIENSLKRGENSFEYQLSKKYDFAFVDLSQNKFKQTVTINGVTSEPEYGTRKHKDWERITDAFYFMREMQPSTFKK